MKKIILFLGLSFIIVSCGNPQLVNRSYSYNDFNSFETALNTIRHVDELHLGHKYIILDPLSDKFTANKYQTIGKGLMGSKKNNDIMDFYIFKEMIIDYSYTIDEETKTLSVSYLTEYSNEKEYNNLYEIINEVEIGIDDMYIETIEQDGVDFYKIKLDEHPLLSIYFETEDESNLNVANDLLSNLKENYFILEFEAELVYYTL